MTESHDVHSPAGASRAQPSSVEPSSPELSSAGHPQIDEALERLVGLDQLEIAAHPDEFDAIHQVLRESLANAGRDEVGHSDS